MAVKKNLAFFTLLIFIVLLFTMEKAFAGEGWVISKITTDRFGNKSYYTTFINKNKIRNESDFSIVLINIEKDSVTIIYPARRVYWTGISDEYKQQVRNALLKRMKDFEDQIEEEDKDIYKDYFDKFQEKLKSLDSIKKSTDIRFLPHDKPDSIGKFEAKQYDVFLDSNLVEKIWITKDIKPYGDTDLEKLMQISAKLAPFDREIKINNSDSYISLIKNSLVVKFEKLIDGKVYSTTEVSFAKKGNVPDSFFTPPKGYKKVSISNIVDMTDSGMLPDLKSPFDKNGNDPFGNSDDPFHNFK